ncbi:hypothetical protein BX600DRAFT_509536 [Xylariales sp. PMI_506]|nr:hypothetical protein BX600DRAFT_509536 [Xylariales sp. PMI_506]
MPPPQVHGATANHQHSQSASQTQTQPLPASSFSRPYNNYYPPRAASSASRYPPVDTSLPVRPESAFAQRAPASTNFHYNRGRSGTVGSNSGSSYTSSTNPTKAPRPNQLRDLDEPSFHPSQPTRFVENTPPSPSFFTADALPRTSSLLPPARGPVNTNASARFNAAINAYAIAEQDSSVSSDSLTIPRRPTSKASSIGAASDGFRNLNRWSASTASSADRDEDYQPQLGQYSQELLPTASSSSQPSKTTNFSRRLSIDSITILTDISPQTTQPPRKLSKRRPSAASLTTSPANSRPRRSSPPPQAVPPLPPPPPPNLPPIVSLPELSPTFAANRIGSPSMTRLSPAAGTPSSVFSSQTSNANGAAEPKDYFWDELADPSIASLTLTRGNNSALLPPAPVPRGRSPTMPEKKGHTRNRSSAAKSSSDSTKTRKQPSQKAMLSKALAKANTAVQLDNAQNYEGARLSYLEACELLQHVLARTTGEEDKKKLEAIRRTYSSRIEELDGMVPAQFDPSNKALPARPQSLAYNGLDDLPGDDEDEEEDQLVIETAKTLSRTAREASPNPQMIAQPGDLGLGTSYGSTNNLTVDNPNQPMLTSSFSSRSPMRRNFEGSSLTLPQVNGGLMPAPLSPRRPLSPGKLNNPEPAVDQELPVASTRLAAGEAVNGHTRVPSHESISWLDPIDESGGSEPSSVHSRTSSLGLRRKHIRAASGATEAEFDAALDAAVEAAYDEGFEPMDSGDTIYRPDDDVVANAMHRVEIAKERVRESEREFEREAAIQAARDKERQRQLSHGQIRDSQTFGSGHFYDGDDSEEERMLEDLTRDYALNSFSFDQKARQQLNNARERESGSSGATQQTWHSSMGSSPPTANTVLSTVNELASPLSKPPPLAPLPPPPQALPDLPISQSPTSAPGVRSRRLSGQNAKQLKIETTKLGQLPAGIPPAAGPAKPGGFIAQQRQALSATSTKPGPLSMRIPESPTRDASPVAAPPTPPQQTEEIDDIRTGSPTPAANGLRKKQSSSSLKSLKSRQMSISNIDSTSDMSPITPISHTMTNSSIPSSRHPSVPALPTPMTSSFGGKATGGFGGLFLFESDFHTSPHSPSSIHYQGSDAPLPLEPCPSDVMLRPFWLMRALYQTLCHPRGGYITNRLFVPRDAWKVKNVKLRSLEDKSSQCDLLTAALMKLARVDSNDADAVLVEMQNLENILEQVQQTLTKKLGNEVGTQGAGAFRERDEPESVPAVPRSASVSGRSAAFSWRRLRSKGSAVNLTSAYGGKSTSGNGGERIAEKEVLGPGIGALPSLPMVAHPSSRPAKRDVTSVKFDGPYAGYMESLARLFDAAQTIKLRARSMIRD